MEPSEIPGHAELVALLSEPGAPPVLTLDIGGSEDINGNGLVQASLDGNGALILQDV